MFVKRSWRSLVVLFCKISLQECGFLFVKRQFLNLNIC